MSTKTTLKRIALVAVSAMGFGVMSVIPANAAIASATTFSLSSYRIVAGSSGLTASLGGAVAEHCLVVTAPDGTESAIGSEVANATLGTSTTVAANASTVTFASSAFLTPGTYTIYGLMGANGEADSAGECTGAAPADGTAVTLAVDNPATASAMSVSMGAATYVAGSQPVIRAWRNTSDTSSSAIKFRVDRSADTTPTLGTVYAATTGGTGAVATYTVDAANDDTAGTYTYTAWVDTNANGLIDGSEVSASVSFVISGAAAAISATANRSSFIDDAGYDAFTVTATVSDASGRAQTATVRYQECTSAGADGGSYTDLVDATAATQIGTNTYAFSGTFDTAAGADTRSIYVCAFFSSDNTLATAVTEGTWTYVTLTLNAQGDLVADGTTSMSLTDSVGIGSYSSTTGLRQDLVGDDGTDIAVTVDPAITSITFTGTALAADAGEAILVKVTPANATTCVSSAWSLARVLADQSFTYTVAATCAAASSYTISFIGDATQVDAVVTFADPAPTITTSPAASWTALNGSTNSITATLKDQFGRVMASKQVIATVAGRNPGTTVLTTNASGQATWTGTDTSSSTVLLTDTVQFSYNYVDSAAAAATASSTARVITYAATLAAVGTVTVVDDSDDSMDIDQVGSASTTAANIVGYTATVKTAAGAPVGSGVLVTCVGNADDKFYGSASGVTTSTSNGQVTVYVYRNKVGYSTITCSANGVSSTAHSTVFWTNTDAQARNVALSAAQSVTAGNTATVTATVTDRWGNAIYSGVGVTFTIAGVGRLQTGSSIANAITTNTAGQSQIQVTSNDGELGDMTVTASITGGQELDSAGYVGATPVAGVKAGNATASTKVTFTKSTAVSTADALLELAKAIGTGKSVEAATDAAAEAIDAANAATDAANLAAEAADAATVAAEEARDAADAATAAVEELATQVATLMSALKAQLTTLSNTVAKIAKKVKA
jgi:trimeric autotransporter adhesin